MEIEKTASKKESGESIPRVSHRKSSKRNSFFGILFLLVLAGLIYSQYELYKLKDPAYQQKVAQAQTQSVIDNVSKLMILPKENPQIVVVQDIEKLRPLQPFFKDAENGDFVLVYSSVAVVYSSTKNKIVNVGPVTRDTTPGAQQTSASTADSSSTASAKTTTKPVVKTPAKTPADSNQ